MSLSENLQYLRAREGITQEQLAERLDVSRQSVSKWESGTSFPEMDTLLKLCDMFKTDMDTLLRGSAEQSFSEDAAGYDRFMTVCARKYAGAVSAIIAGGALMTLLYLHIGDMLSGAVFMLVVAVAVVVLIATGMEEDNFRKQYPTIPDFYTQEQRYAFRRRFIWYIAGGVGAILLGVVLLILAFSFFPEREPYESMLGAAFLAIVAAAVYFLVYGGAMEDKYDIAKYNRRNNPTDEDRARRSRANSACAVIMLLATALFLFVGMSFENWKMAAVIYPVAGILCGAAWMLLGPKTAE